MDTAIGSKLAADELGAQELMAKAAAAEVATSPAAGVTMLMASRPTAFSASEVDDDEADDD
eukprot:scaffold196239_cov31-Tisochrysis_lutea.AAC.1